MVFSDRNNKGQGDQSKEEKEEGCRLDQGQRSILINENEVLLVIIGHSYTHPFASVSSPAAVPLALTVRSRQFLSDCSCTISFLRLPIMDSYFVIDIEKDIEKIYEGRGGNNINRVI